VAEGLHEFDVQGFDRIKSGDLRKHFTEIWNKAAFRNEPTIITHYRKDVAAVIPMQMMNRLASNDNEKQQTSRQRSSKLKLGSRRS
jgi:hypothetical protein